MTRQPLTYSGPDVLVTNTVAAGEEATFTFTGEGTAWDGVPTANPLPMVFTNLGPGNITVTVGTTSTLVRPGASARIAPLASYSYNDPAGFTHLTGDGHAGPAYVVADQGPTTYEVQPAL